ncbi:CTB family bacteriocin [Anabaena sp. PCC 7108]|uniref:CTB family bacteriocin n=1 Tax=Anabaena sp. PCC 7108 TaxID=163908 RepID=UPI0003773775|nr:CTB family bacteriocin [Anabaena sp. PCC 7108]
MSNQINASNLFVALSEQQQELLTGGADFELAASNYANKLSGLIGTSFSGPQGSSATSAGKTNTILTAGQDFLGLGAEPPTGVGALGPAILPTEGVNLNPVETGNQTQTGGILP